MKKLLLSVFTLSACLSANAQCTELFISEYVEGTGNDKAIEIYNPTSNAINLTGYRLERFSNGAQTSAAGGVLSLSGTIAAHGVFIIVNGQTTTVVSPPSPACSPALQVMANQLDGAYPAPTYFNGNDAMVLFKNTTMIDILGKIGDAAMTSSGGSYGWSYNSPYDGSPGSGAILTENHTLVRKASVTTGITVNPTNEFITTAEWDSLPKDTWTGLGTHICTCGNASGINEIVDNTASVIVYPNPSNNGFFNISTSETIVSIEVYNVFGQKVINTEGTKKGNQAKVETANLAKGVYTVKVNFENNKTSVVKLSLQ